MLMTWSYASREEFHRLVDFLKGKGLKIKVEGPMDEVEGSMSFLKRGFQATGERKCGNYDEPKVTSKDWLKC